MTELRVGQVHEDDFGKIRVIYDGPPWAWFAVGDLNPWNDGSLRGHLKVECFEDFTRGLNPRLIASFTPFDGWLSVCHDWLLEHRPNVKNVEKLLAEDER